MVQTLASVLFFLVFIQLFIALSIYIAKTIYDYAKSMRKEKPERHSETKE